MYGYVSWLGQCKVRIRTLGRLASNMFWSFWWHCGYLTLWATREDEEHCKMIMKIHFRNGTGLAPPLCECCINNFCRVQLSAPRFSVWSSAKNGWIYHGEGCFWESRTEIDIAISHKIAESRDIRLGYLTRLGVPLVPHFFDCSMNMETSNLCGS